MLAIRLPDAIEKRLEALAEKTGRTKSFYAKEAIMTHLEDIEDYYLAVHRIENPPERTWSLDELEQEIDLEG
ncbi:MAG: anti-toxin [Desulfobacterales bacterium CG23_combo_of_CG06-09_8_20_14_all_51_8]|nr:MAG: anti-toxin [Desulfobacterales bacterium CG23_combo_of_CG06-09_8_20_14_all_51_8]